MVGEWVNTILGNVLTLQRGFDLPETKRESGPYPVVASTGHVGTHTVAMARGPGVVIGRSGSIGGGQFIQSDFWPLNTTLWVKDFKNNDRRFCYYLLKSINLANFNAGSGVPTLNRNHIHPIPVRVPNDLKEQRAIAHILGTLDDKIELNRRMNETLEQMAQAIFKSWFVDFEFPGHDKTEFVNGLPNGWRKGCLGDILAVSIGGDWGGDHEFEGAIRAISLRGTDLETLKLSGFAAAAPIRWIRKDKLEKRMVNDCDILIGGSGLGPIGKTLYCSERLANLYDLPVTYSNFCRRLTAKSKGIAAFAEIVLENMYLSGEMRQFYIGTSIPNLDVNSLLRYPLIIPPADIVSEFYKVVSGRWAKLFNKENILLAQIRDSFLPKLMTGEVVVDGGVR